MHRAPHYCGFEGLNTNNIYYRQSGLFPVFTGTGFLKTEDACPTVVHNDILCKLHIDIFCDLCYILNRIARIKLEKEVDERC